MQAASVPVKIISFTAKYVPERKSVNLHWITENERDSLQYIIERSFDSLNFIMIGETRSRGNSKSKQHYYFYDSHLTGGILYYRIREVADSGKQYVTPAIKVNTPISQIALTQLLLTKDYKELNFAVISPDSSYSNVLVSDIEGRIEASFVLELKRGANTRSIYTGNLSPGVYFLQINIPEAGNSVIKEFIIRKPVKDSVSDGREK